MTLLSKPHNLTYKDAGVDTHAGAELVRRIAPAAKRTLRPEMLGGLGGFAAMTELPSGYREPVLVSGTDGVGTKLKLAIDHDRHDAVGQDLVAMCVNDVLVTGAEPFLFLDYYATGALDVEVATRVINGIAAACELAGCSLAGGETAEMPGFYGDGEYDLAGFCVGVVEKSEIIDGSQIAAGNALIGIGSSGPHSNGFSLIRRVLDRQGVTVSDSLLDTLLAPTRIYVKAVRAVQAELKVHGGVHITGGGFYENVPRMLRDATLAALIDVDSWQRPEVFSWLQQAGNIEERELLSTFNCGIGFILCVAEDDAEQAVDILQGAGEQAQRIGTMVPAAAKPASGQILITA